MKYAGLAGQADAETRAKGRRVTSRRSLQGSKPSQAKGLDGNGNGKEWRAHLETENDAE